ncbi:hypothetical protein [Kribbella sindirgiensis]|uniref:Uncharacterized protein n=1 Tax=Kribbella sindirgiensis TaxID=1124744 RepID=A0A4R0I4U0_9ACTN|nr:hypothetical protein [Kribbella sindirgiensis]TCC18650.1 hypothetical protein E0H50_38685 [Kribbella sindirgiensis]
MKWIIDGKKPMTVALDAKNGNELWRDVDVVGVSGDGNSVVVAKRMSAFWQLEVRDARTGRLAGPVRTSRVDRGNTGERPQTTPCCNTRTVRTST